MGKDMDNQTITQDISQTLGQIEEQLSELNARKHKLIQEHENQIRVEKEKLQKNLDKKLVLLEKTKTEIAELKAQLKALTGSKPRGSKHTTSKPLEKLLAEGHKSSIVMKALLAGKTRIEAAEEAGVTLSTVVELIKKYSERNEIKEIDGKIIRV